MQTSRPTYLSGWTAALLVGLFGALAAACAPAPEASPTPQPLLPLVGVTPALEPLVAGWIADYADENGVPAFDLTILPLAAAEEDALANRIVVLVAAAEPPPGWFATPLGHEGVAVIVHPQNPVRDLALEDLGALFSGEVPGWGSLAGTALVVQPVVPFPGDELRSLFQDRVMQTRRIASSARLAPSPSMMGDLVAEEAGSIGLLPWSAVDDRVVVVRIEGALPSETTIGNGTYPLIAQVLALAPQEPQGAVREWLVWMQARALDS
jgi:hypothetical protein